MAWELLNIGQMAMASIPSFQALESRLPRPPQKARGSLFFTRVRARARSCVRAQNGKNLKHAPKEDTMTKMQILTLALVFGLRSAAFSAVPERINFQGRLLDSNKNPKNGTYSMTFRVCDSLAASCAGPLWTETQR